MRLQRTAAGAARFSWQICNQFIELNGQTGGMMMVMMTMVMMRMMKIAAQQDRVGRYATAFCLAASFLKRRKGGCGGDEDQDGMMMRMIVTHLL